MTILNEKLEAKATELFIAELGEMPTKLDYDGMIIYADGFYCIVLNNRTIKKTHGLAWRKDN